MNEIWKDVVGYEGLYKVSNLGNIYSCYVDRLLSQGDHKDDYKYVMLSKNGKRKYFTVHRIVAEAFIPNPNNLPVVGHDDDNPMNNNVSNLYWTTIRENNTHNDVHKRRGDAMGKTTYAYNRDGELEYEFVSTQEASRTLGYSNGHIASCLSGSCLTCHNLVLSYTKLSKQEVLDRFKQSDETRTDLNIELLWKKKCKKVVQRDLDGNFIASYPSTREAGRQLGFSPSLIAGVCRGDHKYTHGFIFEYEEEAS